MINIGIIGCGYWGENYLNTIENIEKLSLCWIYNKHNEIPDHKLPAKVRFTKNYQDILDDRKIDAVIISTPPGTHYRIAKDALEAGKDVLLEKPFTTDSEEALSLLKLAALKKRILMVGHVFLYNPAIRELKKIVENKELGRLHYFYCRRTGLGPVRMDINAMWNLAPHDISIVNYLLDGQLPRTVIANGVSFLSPGVEDVVDLVLEYENNLKAFIHVGWSEPQKSRETIVVGDKKKAVIEDTARNPLAIFDSDELSQVSHPRLEKTMPLENQCLHFLECIETGKQPLTNAYTGYTNVKILECAQESLKTGETVEIHFEAI